MRRVSRIAIITLACALAVPVAAISTSSAASANTVTRSAAVATRQSISFTGVRGTANRITAQPRAAATQRPAAMAYAVAPEGLLFPDSTTGPIAPSAAALPGMAAGSTAASNVAAKSMKMSRSARLLRSVNGLSELDSAAVNNGQQVTPPDQALCSGRDASLAGNPMVVFEGVNLAVRETTPGGRQVRPDMNLGQLFRTPFQEGDVRCFWDPLTRTFFFSEIGFPLASGPSPSLENTTVDIAVLNHLGFASYQFDTSLGGTCLGDQPQVGFNLDAVVVSTNEFCGPAMNFQGPIVLVISKLQLVLEAAKVSEVTIAHVSLPGNLAISLDPAHGPGISTAYLVNSFPFTAAGVPNLNATSLGLWTLSNTISVTRGSGTPVLTGTVIPSEIYAFPVRAASTGSGQVVRVVPGTLNGQPHDFPITSEAFLAPGDSRLSSGIEAVRVFGGIQLYAALESSLTPSGDTAVRDGVAWFQINAARKQVVNQGYIAALGTYLLYPVIAKSRGGQPTVGFSLTSPTINPSSGFSTAGSDTINIVAAGAGPHLSFSDAPPFNRARWGDYSAASVLPDDSGIWFAEEYIPPVSDQADRDNWGTSVFETSG